MTTTNPMFRPFQHKSLSLTNRVVMAPMTRSKSPDGTPGEDVVAYYRRRAEGGVGLIITEGTTVDRAGASNDPNIPNFYAQKSLDGWRRVVKEVHAAGAKIAPQIWHQGMVRKPGTGPRPEGKSDGPSGLSGSGKQVAEPMTDEDIADTVEAFAKAAAAAKEIGFDAVELHGAHGYLVDQFFWEQSNRRSDDYGGDLVKRTRFAADIIKAIRQRVGRSSSSFTGSPSGSSRTTAQSWRIHRMNSRRSFSHWSMPVPIYFIARRGGSGSQNSRAPISTSPAGARS